MSKIAIIHFAPLEYYPPIQNLLNELMKVEGVKIKVFTTNPVQTQLEPFHLPSDRIRLLRLGNSGSKLSSLLRYFNYLFFFGNTLLLLVWERPKKILYFETISSWPAYIYKRFFNKECEILIHYHEYTTPEEYGKGMKLTRYFHQLEKRLYPIASWVSHTNPARMSMFKADIFPIGIASPQILPNYPPARWRTPAKQFVGLPIKIVYVGAISLTTMYLREFAGWLVRQQGRVVWDIFSYNYSAEAKEYIHNLKSDLIHIHEGISYEQLPNVLRKYDVGVVLYNGHIPNYVNNAPNKLFEYLACGLDVWFPEVMTGSLDYVHKNGFPKVLSIDFNNLNKFDMAAAIERQGSEREYLFFCEEALKPLIDKLRGASKNSIPPYHFPSGETGMR